MIEPLIQMPSLGQKLAVHCLASAPCYTKAVNSEDVRLAYDKGALPEI